MVKNFAHLEQQQIGTAQGKEATASRHIGKTKQMSFHYQTSYCLSTESSLIVLPVFFLQTLSSARGSN